jgi:hypothetical protein
MNELELKKLENRLAELQAETDKLDSKAEAASSTTLDDIFAPAKTRDGKRTPRIQGKNDPRDNIKGFKVGDFYYDSPWRDAHIERQLIPYPQYPNPGQPFASLDEEARYEDEHNLWLSGKLTLQACIYRTAWKNSGSPYYCHNSEDVHREDLIWMNGVLAGRGLPLITEDQLQEWATAPKQYAKMEDRRPYQIPEA